MSVNEKKWLVYMHVCVQMRPWEVCVCVVSQCCSRKAVPSIAACPLFKCFDGKMLLCIMSVLMSTSSHLCMMPQHAVAACQLSHSTVHQLHKI